MMVHRGVWVLEAALLAWLVATVGDQALKGFKVITFGRPERNALTAAMRVACLALLEEVPPGVRDDLDQMLRERLAKPPENVPNGRVSVKDALTEGIQARLSPLLDRTVGGDGRSDFDRLGVDGGWISAELPGIVIRSIQQVGPSYPSLQPLVSQLNADIIQEQAGSIQEQIDEVLGAVEALALQSQLAPAGRDSTPAPGRADLLQPVVDAILRLPSMGDYGARMMILTSLSPRIRDVIPRSSVARLDVINTVRTCRNYSGGLQELVAAIRVVERDSVPMRELDAAILALGGNESVSLQRKKGFDVE